MFGASRNIDFSEKAAAKPHQTVDASMTVLHSLWLLRAAGGTVRRLATATPAAAATPRAAPRAPMEEYAHRVGLGKLQDDPYQRKIIASLSDLHTRLTSYQPPRVELPDVDDLKPKTGISRFFLSLRRTGGGSGSSASFSAASRPQVSDMKGIYLYGDVGCGKTMLMDLFYATIPSHLAKRRIHFHQFMQYLHKRLHLLKLEHNHWDLDVLPILASEILRESTILCFDEFQVTDVADAMLLRRLLALILSPEYGVVLFATLNRAPDDLYINGVQRASFIPCIQQIKRQTKVVYLNSPTDYRKVPKPVSLVFYSPKPGVRYQSKTCVAQRKKHVDDWFAYFSKGTLPENVEYGYSLEIWGRKLHVPKCAPPHVAQFTFDELCGKPLAAGDYLQLASSFESFVVTDIPYLSINCRDSIRRFITFLDATYDAGGKLAVTSAAPFKDLFVEPEDVASDEFELYKTARKRSKGESIDVNDDELVTKHGFDRDIAKKANMFANDEEKFAFARALSRLAQMSTQDWVDQ